MAHARHDLRERHDGFGTRRLAHDHRLGMVEILDLAPTLATEVVEQAIAARAARMTELAAGLVSPVHAVRRDGSALRIVSGAVDGLPLSAVIDALQAGTLRLADDAVLDIVSAIARALAALHALPGGIAHGAITPAHIALARTGRVVFTDGGFADALEALQCNREHHWRELGVALPPAASLPRFDQRADVTQLGMAALSLLLRRAVRGDEFPAAIAPLVIEATPDANGRPSPVRLWLQQALQLHARPFGSAVEADRALALAVMAAAGREAVAVTVQRIVRLMCGEPVQRPRPAVRIDRRPPAAPRPGVEEAALAIVKTPPSGPVALLRAMLRAI